MGSSLAKTASNSNRVRDPQLCNTLSLILKNLLQGIAIGPRLDAWAKWRSNGGLIAQS
jgi:hypothetical protein